MPFPSKKHMGYILEHAGKGIHSPGAVEYYRAQEQVGTLDDGSPHMEWVDIATSVGIYSYNNNMTRGTEIVLDPNNLSMSAPSATLKNVTVWSGDSILTRAYADQRYAQGNINIDGGTAASNAEPPGIYDGGSATAN